MRAAAFCSGSGTGVSRACAAEATDAHALRKRTRIERRRLMRSSFVPKFFCSADHFEKLLAVAVWILAEAALSNFEDGSIGQIAFKLRIPEHQAEAGDRRGEFKIRSGGRKCVAVVLDC